MGYRAIGDHMGIEISRNRAAPAARESATGAHILPKAGYYIPETIALMSVVPVRILHIAVCPGPGTMAVQPRLQSGTQRLRWAGSDAPHLGQNGFHTERLAEDAITARGPGCRPRP